MNDYLGIIGLACLNVEFREALVTQGFAAVANKGVNANLTELERGWLDDFTTTTPAKRTAASEAFAAVRGRLDQVCETPPCGRFNSNGTPDY